MPGFANNAAVRLLLLVRVCERICGGEFEKYWCGMRMLRRNWLVFGICDERERDASNPEREGGGSRNK